MQEEVRKKSGRLAEVEWPACAGAGWEWLELEERLLMRGKDLVESGKHRDREEGGPSLVWKSGRPRAACPRFRCFYGQCFPSRLALETAGGGGGYGS